MRAAVLALTSTFLACGAAPAPELANVDTAADPAPHIPGPSANAHTGATMGATLMSGDSQPERIAERFAAAMFSGDMQTCSEMLSSSVVFDLGSQRNLMTRELALAWIGQSAGPPCTTIRMHRRSLPGGTGPFRSDDVSFVVRACPRPSLGPLGQSWAAGSGTLIVRPSTGQVVGVL